MDGGFGKWQEATACSVTCGTGVKRIARKCDSPTPRKSGKKCEGRSVKTVDCKKKACPSMSLHYQVLYFKEVLR